MNKKLFFTLLVLGSFQLLLAQKAQKIHGIAKEEKSIAYYEQQAKLWKIEVDKNPKDADAWQNYYKANRAFYQLTEADLWAVDQQAIFAKLTPLLDKAKAHIGNSFDYYFLKANNSLNPARAENLKKAYAIDPDRPEIHGWIFTDQIFNLDYGKLTKSLAEKMMKQNLYSNANLMWNYNAMMGMEKNAVFIANGDMDALPKWALQFGEDIRSDLLILSKWALAGESKYRKGIFKELGLKLPTKGEKDFKNLAQYADYLAKYILTQSKRPVYTPVGTPTQFFKDQNMEDKVYLEGLNFKYSNKNYDNISTTVNLFEKVYDLEYLLRNFQYHPQDEMVKEQMNLTYLPGLMKSLGYFESKGNKQKADYYQALIDHVVKDSKRGEVILNGFKETN